MPPLQRLRCSSRPPAPLRPAHRHRAGRARTRRSAGCPCPIRKCCSWIKTRPELQETATDPAFHGAKGHLCTFRQLVIRRTAEKGFTDGATLLDFQFGKAGLQVAVFLVAFGAMRGAGAVVDEGFPVHLDRAQIGALAEPVDRLVTGDGHQPGEGAGELRVKAPCALPYGDESLL